MSSRPCLIAILAAAAGWLCRAPVRAAEDSTAAAPRPMMVSEAKLPRGFPAPGPVGQVVIKEYPEYRLARAAADERGSDSSFMRLFRHIKRNEIAMTAPVEMTESAAGGGQSATAMAFLYASPEIGKAGPDPADTGVVVEDVTAATVVSIGVRGSYTNRTFDRGRDRLRDWLADHPEWIAAGPSRTLAYNSPFVPGMLKYAEVQIPVIPAPPPAKPAAAE